MEAKTSTDLRRLTDRLETALLASVAGSPVYEVIPMEPVTAARPRVSKWGTYYPPKYTKWKQAATEILTKSKAALAPMTGTLALVVEQVMTKPRTSKLDIPVGDIDNHLKGPMDALTKAGKVWGDDKQVACVLAIKRFSTGENDKPGTYITVVPLYGE